MLVEIAAHDDFEVAVPREQGTLVASTLNYAQAGSMNMGTSDPCVIDVSILGG